MYFAARTQIPGPGAHAPERCPLANHSKRAPAYSMKFRTGKMPIKEGPGPVYMVPTCIGPEIPDIKAEGAYTMYVYTTILSILLTAKSLYVLNQF